MATGYFDDKVITRVNEYYIVGHGWMTAMERKNLLESIRQEEDFAVASAKERKILENTDMLNVHYIQLHKTPDGEVYITEGNADINYIEYRELTCRGYYVRRDSGYTFESGRPKRDFVDYVWLHSSLSGLRKAAQILRLKLGEEAGRLFFSNN